MLKLFLIVRKKLETKICFKYECEITRAKCRRFVLYRTKCYSSENKERHFFNTRIVEGVIVTALGIKREEKSLGYTASKVKSEDLTQVASQIFCEFT